MNAETLISLVAAAARYRALSRSQYWDAEQLAAYQAEHLAGTLEAAAAIPFYHSRLGEAPHPSDLESLPVLRRSDLAQLNESVRSQHSPAQKYMRSKSSGSTGESVEMLFDQRHQAGRFASRARYLASNGWNPLARSAWLIGIRPGSPDGSLVNAAYLPRAKFFSHLEAFKTQADWLIERDPEYIYSLPSNLEGLLAEFAARGQGLPSLKRIFTGGEILEDSVRNDARRYLQVEIADNYGSTEAFLAWQCPSGGYHTNAEHVLIEVVDENGRSVRAGSPGRVLVTTLQNRLMPLIRYDLGDFAIASSAACSCGRTLPMIEKILGRGVNLFRLPDGALFSPWQLVESMKAMPAVRQVQIEQQTLDRYIVRYAAQNTLGADVEIAIRRGFRTIVGQGAEVIFERMAEIPRGAGGKFMAAVSSLSGQTTIETP